jgi:hypothetical protein
MGVENTNAPTSQEGTPMSDLVRREVFSNLGSRLTSLIDIWPKRNYHYEELQSEISHAVLDYNVLVGQDSISDISRREALKSVVLVPIQLCVGLDGIVTLHKAQADTGTLLKRLAAGIAICWYLRHWRGKELQFTSDLTSEYIKILQLLSYSKSEVHRKAAAGLLSQSFMLKGSLAQHLENSDQAIVFTAQAIEYSIRASNLGLEAYANRMMAQFHYTAKKYKEALKFAERAEALIKLGNLDKLTQSWIYSGLTYCQAFNGQVAHSVASLNLARDLFDPRVDPPVTMQYSIGVLNDCSGIASLRNRNYQEAADFFDEEMTSRNISALGKAQAKLGRTKTEVSRDDQIRDMNLCITLLTEVITGARELDSKWYIREAHETFDLLRIAWPRENAIKKLGKDHFS